MTAKILQCAFVDNGELEAHGFIFKYAREYYKYLSNKRSIESTYAECLKAGAITSNMQGKLALAGIRYEDMVAIYQKEGEQGVKKLLTGGVENIQCVTKNKKVLEKLVSHLSKLE